QAGTHALLVAMLRVNSQVSDLIFSPGRPPQVEIHGQLVSVDASGLRSLTADDTRRIASDLIGNNKQAITMLREQGSCDISFALRAALRQAPKVIFVGELRDRETMEMVLEAAETGHLILSTLNSVDIANTVERIVSAFSTAEQSSIRGRLAKTLRYVISQQLIPRRNGERTAIIEIFKANPRTAQYIECDDRSGRSLLEAVKNGAADGMQHFDGEIEKL